MSGTPNEILATIWRSMTILTGTIYIIVLWHITTNKTGQKYQYKDKNKYDYFEIIFLRLVYQFFFVLIFLSSLVGSNMPDHDDVDGASQNCHKSPNSSQNFVRSSRHSGNA